MKSFLFKPHMRQATVVRRKTQTRRLIDNQPGDNYKCTGMVFDTANQESFGAFRFESYNHHDTIYRKPKFLPGDIGYIREKFRVHKDFDELSPASFPEKITIEYSDDIGILKNPGKWRSSLHLPMHLARYFFEIHIVKAERLQNISRDDCLREGIQVYADGDNKKWYQMYDGPDGLKGCDSPYVSFQTLWMSINGAESWNSNPWVFVYTYEFKRRNEINLEEIK